jgi:hypothetical protein
VASITGHPLNGIRNGKIANSHLLQNMIREIQVFIYWY